MKLTKFEMETLRRALDLAHVMATGHVSVPRVALCHALEEIEGWRADVKSDGTGKP